MEELHLDPLSPATAEGVTELFRALYGEGYPDPAVYEDGELLRLQAQERQWTWVARNQKDRVVGSISIVRQAPNPHVYTLNHAVVLPEYRGRSLALQLTMLAASEVLQESDVTGSLTATGCHNLKTQELVYKGSFLPTALLPESLRPESLPLEGRVEARVSLLVSYLSLQDQPHIVYLPGRCRSLVESIYGWLGLRRELQPAAMTPEPVSQVHLEVQEGRLNVRRCGADLIQHVPRSHPPRQVVLAMDVPEIGFGEELLHQLDYRPCGIFPSWFGGDGMVFQKNSIRPTFEADLLFAAEAKQLATLVREHWSA